jgi:hypothetical protein
MLDDGSIEVMWQHESGADWQTGIIQPEKVIKVVEMAADITSDPDTPVPGETGERTLCVLSGWEAMDEGAIVDTPSPARASPMNFFGMLDDADFLGLPPGQQPQTPKCKMDDYVEEITDMDFLLALEDDTSAKADNRPRAPLRIFPNSKPSKKVPNEKTGLLIGTCSNLEREESLNSLSEGVPETGGQQNASEEDVLDQDRQYLVLEM